MTDELAYALELVGAATVWWMDVEFGSALSAVHGARFALAARYGDVVVYLLPPDDEHAVWRLGRDRVGADEDDELEELGEVTVAQIVDLVPYGVEDIVLEITKEAACLRLYDDDETERRAGMRLSAQWEQGEAHTAHWKRRMHARYGNTACVRLDEEDQLRYERGEESGHPALLIAVAGESPSHVLVAPDREHPWRRSEIGHVDEFGERLTMREALELAGPDHADWVREQTVTALDDTLGALAALHPAALTRRDRDALGELARLAKHARRLADDLEEPLVAEA